jgi:cytochrome c553
MRINAGPPMRAIIAALILLAAAGAASAATLQERLAPCLDCHGESGQSQTPDVPSLGAQQSQYVLIQLYMFREKPRTAAPDLEAFADAIAKLPAPHPATDAVDPGRLERARTLAAANRCNFCHQTIYTGYANVPRIADQREDYLVKTLREYKSNARLGYDPNMFDVLQPVSDENIADLAYLLARQPG